MSIIMFKDSVHLKEMLITDRPNGPAILESSTVPQHTVKSRTTKEPFSAIFTDGLMRTKKEYVWVGANYENVVNAQRSREGSEADFAAKPRTWGVHLSPSVVEHKEDYYLAYFIKLNAHYNTKSEKVWHTEKGTVLPALLIDRYKTEFAPVKSVSAIQELQGVENIIEPRTVKLEGLTRFRAGGITYIREGYANRSELKEIRSQEDLNI